MAGRLIASMIIARTLGSLSSFPRDLSIKKTKDPNCQLVNYGKIDVNEITNRGPFPLLLIISKCKLTSRTFVHYMYSSTYTSFSPNAPLLLCCAVCGDRPNEASSAIIVAQSIPHSHSLSTKRVTRICLASPLPSPSILSLSFHSRNSS